MIKKVKSSIYFPPQTKHILTKTATTTCKKGIVVFLQMKMPPRAAELGMK